MCSIPITHSNRTRARDLEMQVTATTAATAAISITSQEHFVPSLSHNGGRTYEPSEVSRCDGATLIRHAAASLRRQQVARHTGTTIQTTRGVICLSNLNQIPSSFSSGIDSPIK